MASSKVISLFIFNLNLIKVTKHLSKLTLTGNPWRHRLVSMLHPARINKMRVFHVLINIFCLFWENFCHFYRVWRLVLVLKKVRWRLLCLFWVLSSSHLLEELVHFKVRSRVFSIFLSSNSLSEESRKITSLIELVSLHRVNDPKSQIHPIKVILTFIDMVHETLLNF
jgi:hypothetical protein